MRRNRGPGGRASIPLVIVAAAAAMISAAASLAQEDPFAGLEQGEGGPGSGSVPSVSVTVKRGDTLEKISREYYFGHVSNVVDGETAIATANGMSPRQPLRAGQQIQVPYPFADKPGRFDVPRTTGLDQVAAQAYAYTDHPSLWWPVIDQANPGLGPPGGHRVTRGTHLVLPAVPIDRSARAKMVEDAYAKEWDHFRSLLDSGHLSDAYRESLVLRQGFVPLLVKEDSATYGKQATREFKRIAAVMDAYAAMQMAGGLPATVPLDGDLDGYLTRATDILTKLKMSTDTLRALGEGDLATRVDTTRSSHLGAIAAGIRGQVQALVPKVNGPAAPSTGDDTSWRASRLSAFKISYTLSRLASKAGLTDLETQIEPDLVNARRLIPPPLPVYPGEVQRAYHKDPLGRRSITVEHPRCVRYWMPMAVAYAKGLWTRFPAARDARGALISVEEVFKAIIIHESRGVHEENGVVVKNVNSPTSIDYGFAQINNQANGRLPVRLDDMARVMGPPWTAKMLASKDYLDVPKANLDKTLVLDIMKPAHNLIAGVIVLSYSINKAYPQTATPQENLIKSLAGYNHGCDNPDLDRPWLDLVHQVDATGGDQSKITAVAYGIGMKLYLGMEMDASEVDWWARLQAASLDRVTRTYVDTFYAYAHY